MTLNDSALAYIRTYVPYAVGLAVGWILLRLGLNLHGETESAIAAFGVAAVTNVYYVAVRFAEAKFPALGVLLGAPRTPIYENVSDLWNSVIRTAIPTVVSATVVAIFGTILHLDAGEQLKFIAVGTALVSAAYYAAAREVARRWPSWLNFLAVDAPAAYQRKH